MTLTAALAQLDTNHPGFTHAEAATLLTKRLGRPVTPSHVRSARHRLRHASEPRKAGRKLEPGAARRIRLPADLDAWVIEYAESEGCGYDGALEVILRRGIL